MDDKRSNGKNYSDDVAMVIKVEKDSYEENTYYAAECCTPDGILWGISTDLQVLSYEKDHYIIDYPPLYVPDGYINILHALTSAIDAAGYTGQWTYRPLERALQEEIEKFGVNRLTMVDLFDYLDRTCNQANSTDLEEIVETADIKRTMDYFNMPEKKAKKELKKELAYFFNVKLPNLVSAINNNQKETKSGRGKRKM